jgi:asparagine synthase (glutamine-hydrolysing)
MSKGGWNRIGRTKKDLPMAICGIANTNGVRPIAQQIEAMVSAMNRNNGGTLSLSVGGERGMGVTSALTSTSIHSGDQLLVTCDAEIYNQQELQNGLADVRPAATPAALIAHLYLRHGEEFVKKLGGVFSLAVWDDRQHRLLLARDRLGIKPLCYAETPTSLIFASYPSGILASQLIAKGVNLRAIVDYLNFNVVPAPLTAYVGLFKLQPGEYLVRERGETRKARYWELRYPEKARGTNRQLAEQLFSRLEESVRVTSAGLDPEQTGCFLSGGTDSSSIAGLFARIKQRPVRVFSIGFAEQRFDELRYAQLAARHFGLTHFERILRPEETYDLIPKIVELFDEPFANASAIPTYACLELAKEHGISVMLAGDGGDELFGGNERYRIHQVYDLYQRVPRTLRKMVEPALFAIPADRGFIGKAKAYIRRSNIPNLERYSRWRLLQVFPPTEVLGTAMPHINGDALGVVRAHHRAAAAHSELNRLLHIDINMTLGDEDIPKVVRTAERNGVNVRFPYLHQSLAEFSGRLPVHLKVKGFEKRYLFKRATAGFLPPEILQKKKHGFGLPIGIWLKTDPKLRTMAHDVLLSPTAYQRGYFRRDFIEKLMSNLEQDDTPYFGDLLWVFLMLELWHRRHVAGASL